MQPLPNSRARLASYFLVSVGVLWGFILLGFIALMSGFFGNTPPWHYVGKVLLWSSWLWIGPLLLTGGAVCSLRGKQLRASSISIWAGCFILTAMVLYQIVALLHDATDSLIMKPTFGQYAIYLVAMLLTWLAAAAAVQLSRNAR
jgi:hypothetical protein